MHCMFIIRVNVWKVHILQKNIHRRHAHVARPISMWKVEYNRITTIKLLEAHALNYWRQLIASYSAMDGTRQRRAIRTGWPTNAHGRQFGKPLTYMGHSCWNYHITIKKCTWYLTYFVFTNSIFFYMIMDRCIYLNQDHFVTKLNNGFWISGRTFYPQKLITVTMEKCNCWLKVYNKLKLIQSTTAKFT